jgi:arylsulfatase A-like enzyme
MILWGADFKRGKTLVTPACNVDIAPTILALKGISGTADLDGRVLKEAFRDGPDEEKTTVETRVLTTARESAYQAAIQITVVGRHRYVDKAWRLR